MRNLLICFVILGISGCTSGIDLQSVNLGPLFHDSNSKVWMVDQVISEDQNFAPKHNLNKDVIIFYENGKCIYQPLRTLGDFVGLKGEFNIFSNERSITLNFPKDKWDFIITNLSEDTIVLKPTKESDLKYELLLIPLPEL